MRLIFTLPLICWMFTGKIAYAQGKDTLCFIQINDIYEITPLQGGKAGGIARIATVVDEHRKRYPTYTFVAGDFLNPSVMGTARVGDERLNGKQMVDMFNRIGVDYVTFGNHEFDIDETSLQKRIDESSFTWVSSNVMRADGNPFYKNKGQARQYFARFATIPSPRNQFAVGIFSLTLPSNTPPFSKFLSYEEGMHSSIPDRQKKKQILIGLTHLSMQEDMELLKAYPAIRMLMGGHEHENMFHKAGNGFVAKADANGKTIYRHLIYKDGKKITIDSKLIRIDETIEMNKAAADAVKSWEDIAYASFRKAGFEPDRTVVTVTDTLNGMENSIRYRQNLLGRAVTEGLMTGGDADASFINSGSIRIDDMVSGALTELDIIRIMPFGGKVIELTMKGDLLLEILKSNDSRKGLGGYLQLHANFTENKDGWMLKGAPIETDKTYRIRTIEYLSLGLEKGLEYLNPKNTSVVKTNPVVAVDGNPMDIRKGLITYLKKRYGS